MLLGLDLGTAGVKALLVQPSGHVVARAQHPVRLLHPGGAAVEQDIEEIWSAVREALAELSRRAGLSRVRAVGVSSQGGALLPLDGSGRPAGRVISWLDGRGAPYDRAATESLGPGWFAERVGHGGSGVALGQLLRLRQERPEALHCPNGIGFVGDEIVKRLCGVRAHDPTSLSIAGLLNPRLSAADPDVLRMVGLREDQLPALLPAHRPAGALRAEAARQVGLPAGIPVSPAVHDQYAAALGSGVVHPGDAMVGAGTAWVLLAAQQALTQPVTAAAFVAPHLVEGLYGQMLSMVNGGSSFAWVQALVGLDRASAEQVDALMEAVPAGSDGVRFWPFLACGGGAGLAPDLAGRLFGLRLEHDRRHLLRAAAEGLCLELARHLRMLTSAGLPIGRLVICGGAARSRVTPAILADVAGIPVARCREADTSALGAAMIARALADERRDLAAIAREMASVAEPVGPGPDAAQYGRLLEEYLSSLPPAGDRGPAP